jgi:hypothetical protein
MFVKNDKEPVRYLLNGACSDLQDLTVISY